MTVLLDPIRRALWPFRPPAAAPAAAGVVDEPVPLPPPVPPGRSVALAGRGAIFVREAPGPPGADTVVLLHGLGVTGGVNFEGAFADLGRSYRVLAVDHRGHGRGVRTGRFRLEDCADDVAALLGTLDVGPALVVGYSMGGPIALLLWRRHPSAVAGLVLVATSRWFRQRPGEFLGFTALTLAGLLPVLPPVSLVTRLSRVLAVEDPTRRVLWQVSELRRHDPRAVVQAAAALGRFDAGPWVERIDVPVAVIATEHDQVVPLDRQVRTAMAIPTAVLHPVDAGHAAFARLRDPAALAAVRRACDEVAGRARRAARRRAAVPS